MDTLSPSDLAAIAIGAAWAVLMMTRRGQQLLATWDPGRVSLFLGTAGILGLAIWMESIVPLRQTLEGGEIERLYRASAVPSWRQLVAPEDGHHPGLWFALVHWPFVHFHHALVVPAILDRGCAILAILLAGAIARTYAGALAALIVMVNVAFLPLLLLQARDVSDVSLYVALGLCVLLAHIRIQQTGRRIWQLVLACSLGMLLHASYAAVLLLLALALDILLDRQRWRDRLVPLCAGALVGSPRLVHLASLLPQELRLRSESSRFGWYWASTPVGTFFHEALVSYFTPLAWALLPLLVVAGLAGARLLPRRGPLIAGVCTYSSVLFLQSLFRIRDYYALFLPLLVLLLVGSLLGTREPGEDLRGSAVRRGLPLLASLLCATTFIGQTASSWKDSLGHEALPDRSRPAVLAALADGARVLTYDSVWQHATWNFLVDRWGTMDGCFSSRAQCFENTMSLQDVGSDRRVQGLAGRMLSAGWEKDSVRRLRTLQGASDVHLLVDRDLPNQEVLDYVQGQCALLAKSAEFETWKCPRL